MPDAGKHRPWLRIAAPGAEGIADLVRERLEARLARGVVTGEEIDRIREARLRLFDTADGVSEAFRRCCVAWEVDRPAPITSHRPVLGWVLVAAKKVVGRLLRFQNEAFLLRQREFNRSLLVVLRELLERSARDGNR